MVFQDRSDAGKKLAEKLKKYTNKEVVVYALPRGGVVVGYEVAKALHSPLDLIITRKIGHPTQSEYAIGAVAENGHYILNIEAASEVDKEYLTSEIEAQKKEAQRRRQLYLKGKKPIDCKGKIAILVDDGVATGLTMRAAIKELKFHYKPEKIIIAVPVAPQEAIEQLKSEGIGVVSLLTTREFLGAIGAYYANFPQVSDEEVIELLKKD